MKEKINKIQKSPSKKEEEISERIYENIKEEKVSDSEVDEMILKEIESNMSFPENWQKHYAKEQIKNRIKEKYNFLPTTRIRRFFNAVLDYFGLYVFGFVFGYIIVVIGLYPTIERTDEWLLGWYFWIFGIIAAVLYYVVSESIWSKTPAKFITKTKVITEYGGKPNFKTIFVRTLMRLIPFEALSFLSPEHPRGWHDRWSKTIVIDDIKKLPGVQKSEIFYCSKCGNKLDGDSNFCAKCGTKI